MALADMYKKHTLIARGITTASKESLSFDNHETLTAGIHMFQVLAEASFALQKHCKAFT